MNKLIPTTVYVDNPLLEDWDDKNTFISGYMQEKTDQYIFTKEELIEAAVVIMKTGNWHPVYMEEHEDFDEKLELYKQKYPQP